MEYKTIRKIMVGSENGLELERNVTRLEAVVIAVRLGRNEKYALQVDRNPHYFTDVPSWASNIVGYANAIGYVSGISDTKLGSNDTVTAQQYLTFLLRMLGHQEEEGNLKKAV